MTRATQDEITQMARGLNPARKRDLEAVCRTNGGGLRIPCRVNADGEVVPAKGPMAALFSMGLIQGKSGGYERVVHTQLGLAVCDVIKHMREKQA